MMLLLKYDMKINVKESDLIHISKQRKMSAKNETSIWAQAQMGPLKSTTRLTQLIKWRSTAN